MNATARLWSVQSFPDGQHAVSDGGPGPWLEVRHADGPTQYAMAQGLARLLNCGPSEPWLADMDRITDAEIIGSDGCSVRATGPAIDADPPNGDWREQEGEPFETARRQLMDRILGA